MVVKAAEIVVKAEVVKAVAAAELQTVAHTLLSAADSARMDSDPSAGYRSPAVGTAALAAGQW